MPRKVQEKKPKAKEVESKKIKKESAADKRKAAKKEQVGKDKSKGKEKLLELGLLCDCTSSMFSWIDRAKKTLIQIIDNVVASCDGSLKVRVCFIGYRDHCDKARFSIIDFTDKVKSVRDFIEKVAAQGGGDTPEDVAGGFRKCLDQKWTPGSERQVFHIFDAPCHGKKYHDVGWDSYQDGDPHGLVIEDLMDEFYKNKISFTCIKLNDESDKMMKIMQKHHPDMQITDMAKASQGKSAEEVNKLFIDSASVILRDKVGGKDASGAKRTATKKGKPLWDPKKLEVKDIFSNITYLQVKKIDGNMISVQNHYGGSWIISKNLMARDMDSADHFGRDIKCSMTELSTILQSCGDYVFKVQFRKKVDAKEVEEKLQGVSASDWKKADKLNQLSKQLIEGERCEMVCHLVECDTNLGRSVVVDLSAIPGKNIRQVDHRTIDFIIFKNVKYSLGKGARPGDQADLQLPIQYDKDAVTRWDTSKLQVGDWFSQINYYKIRELLDKDTVKVTTTKNSKEEIKMSRDILEYEMHSGTIFDKEEKMPRTEIVDLLMNAKQAVFTIKFNKKVDDAHVKEVLGSVKGKKPNDLKKMAKDLVSGKESEMTCCLASSDGQLGRSTVFDLHAPHGMNFRQVDHRTIQWLVLRNVKYVAK